MQARPAAALCRAHAVRRVVETLEARRLLAVVTWDGGGDDVNWTSSGNWSSDALPEADDDVIIDLPGTPTIHLNGALASVRSLTSSEALILDSGMLSMAEASTITGHVVASGAEITGAGDLTLTSTFNWQAGHITGAGKLILPTGSSTTVAGHAFRALGRSVDLSGTITYSGSSLYVGYNGASDLRVLNGGLLRLHGDVFLSEGGSGVGKVSLLPGGTIDKSSGATTGVLGLPLVASGGTLGASSGTLQLTYGASFSGAVTLASDIDIPQGTLDFAADATFNGPGTPRLIGGTITFTGTPSLKRLVLAGATLDGTADVTITQSLDWQAGQIIGSGKLIIPSGAVAAVTGGSFHGLGRDADVAGTLHYDGSSFYVGYNGASELRILSGGLLRLNDDVHLAEGGSGTGQLTLLPNGTIAKIAGAAAAVLALPLVASGGTLGASSGTIHVTSGASFSGAVTLSSDFDITGGTVEFAAGSTFNGVGTPRLISSVVTFTGTPVLKRLVIAGGSLTGDADITITQSLTWEAGSISGTGKLLLPAGSTTTIPGGSFRGLSRNADLGGIIDYSGSSLYVGYDAPSDLRILSGGTLRLNGDVYIAEGGAGFGKITLLPGGVIDKTAGEVLGTIAVPFFASGGTIGASAGSLSLNGGASFSGTVALASDIDFPTGTVNFAPGASFSGPGTPRVTSGAVTFTGTPVLSRLIVAGGSLTSSVDITVTASLVWEAGSIGGTGKLILPFGSVTSITAATFHPLARNVDLGGTINYDGSSLYIGYNGPSIVNVLATGRFNLDGDVSLSDGGSGALISIVPGGVLEKTSGAGTGYIALPVTNGGRVASTSGTLSFLTAPTNLLAGELTGGTWLMRSGGIEFSQAFTTNNAIIQLEPDAVSNSLSNIATNRGQLLLRFGADFTFHSPFAPAPFNHAGTIDLSPGSALTIHGDLSFSGVGQPIIRSEISGPGASQRGIVSVDGNVNLFNSASPVRFDPDLVGSYDPAAGTRFDIITASGTIADDIDAFFGGSTPSGRQLLAGKDTQHVFAYISSSTAPLPAPSILSVTHEYQTREAIVFEFNTDVSAFLSRRDYLITSLTSPLAVLLNVGTLTYNATSNRATLVFTNELPDGKYKLTVQASDISNAAGTPASGAPIVLNFHVLRGDANRDMRVDFDDLLVLSQNYGQSGRNYGQGNFDYSSDGAVGFDDLLLLAQRYGTVLALPAPALPAPAAGKRKSASASVVA